MPLAEAIFVAISRAVVSTVLNRFAPPPAVHLSYGKSGDNDLIRMHYQRPDGPRPSYPWVIIEARSLWPFGAPLYASDDEAVRRGPTARHLRALRLKPGAGVFFIPLKPGQEFPSSVHLLLRVERAVPGERRWAVARALRPSRFDLRFLKGAPASERQPSRALD